MNDWRHRARCRGSDPELFFPDGHSAAFDGQIAAAKTVCAHCPVQRNCLEFALAIHQRDGIWGGLTDPERRDLQRRRQLAGVR